MCAFLQNVAFDSLKEALISADLNLGKYTYFCSVLWFCTTVFLRKGLNIFLMTCTWVVSLNHA